MGVFLGWRRSSSTAIVSLPTSLAKSTIANNRQFPPILHALMMVAPVLRALVYTSLGQLAGVKEKSIPVTHPLLSMRITQLLLSRQIVGRFEPSLLPILPIFSPRGRTNLLTWHFRPLNNAKWLGFCHVFRTNDLADWSRSCRDVSFKNDARSPNRTQSNDPLVCGGKNAMVA